MKLTKSQLKKIIKEELGRMMSEDETLGGIEASPLMAKALKSNKIPSLNSLIQISSQHADLIVGLNDASENTKYSMGNAMSLSLAILHLTQNNTRAAERWLKKNG